MTTKMNSFISMIAAAVYGMASLTVFPNSHHTQYISTSEEISRLSWNRTGNLLKKAMDKVGQDYNDVKVTKK